MRKSTPMFFSALCLTGLLTTVSAATAATAAAAKPSATVPVAAPGVPAAAPTAAVPAAPAVASPAAPASTAPIVASTPVVAVDSAKAKDSVKAVAADTAKAPVSSAAAAPAPMAGADSAKAALPDSAKAAPAVATTVDSSAYADSTAQPGAKKKRKRVVRETTVNTIDDLKGRYRSPKKALFMSMVVPGLGQAYVGQHWANYARGGFYFLTDVALAYGWHYYVVDRQDAQIAKYRSFADKNWRQYKYEDVIASEKEKVADRNQHRENYCETVQDNSTTKGNTLLQGCKVPTSADYEAFRNEYDDELWGADSVTQRRNQFPNTHNFYELIGKENEFVTGWVDVDSIVLGDSAYYAMGTDGNPLKNAAGRLVLATTPFQQKYIGMRAQANDYARMQAYFLGGIVVNHIVSAIDAALAAHYHNKALYQTETNWWDRLRLDSHLAWDGYAPAPTVVASFTF